MNYLENKSEIKHPRFNLYSVNYKILLREIKEYISNQWGRSSWIRRLYITVMSVVPRLI